MHHPIGGTNDPFALHRYSCFKNTTKHWIDLDQRDLWLTHMVDPIKRSILETYGWDREDAITYSFNSLGFRCDEFTTDPGIISLGCSFTCGIGLPNDVIWPTLVAQSLGLKSWNLGIGSASIDVCFRLLDYYISKLNAKAVILLKPEPSRFELFLHDSTSEWIIPSQHYREDIEYFRKIWYENELNFLLNYNKTIMAMQYICSKYNVKLLEKDFRKDLINAIPWTGETPQFWTNESWARDFQHPGVLQHKILAQAIINELNNDKVE